MKRPRFSLRVKLALLLFALLALPYAVRKAYFP